MSDDTEPTPEPDEGEQPAPESTAYLGSYEEFEAALVLDILDEAGIFAFSKAPLDEAERQPYGKMMSERGVIMVDAARRDDAEAIVAEELPKHIEAIAASMEALSTDPDEEAHDEEAHDEEAHDEGADAAEADAEP